MKESSELTLHPQISQKSAKIAKRLSNQSCDRLYSQILEKDNQGIMSQKRKNIENDNTFSSRINNSSKQMH
jgi:hypothetical protein